MDGSCCENISEISLSAPPSVHQFSKQKNQKISSLEKNESSISISSLNSIPFDKQKHTNSPVSLHSEKLFGDLHSDVKNSDSPLHFAANTNEDERIQKRKEFVRPTVHESLNDKSNVVAMESNVKTMPFISVSHRQFEAQVRGKLNHFGNKTSLEANPCYDIMHNTALKNDNFSSDLRLQSKDMFSAPESSNGIHRSIYNSSKSLAGLHKLFHERRFYSGKQKAFSFNSMDSSGTGFKKDNSLCKTFLCNADTLTKHCQEVKYNREQLLHSTKTESKLMAFNFSFHLENQRKLKDDDGNLNQKKVSRRLSASSNDSFISKADKNFFFVQKTCHGRKCKSEVQILHETKNMPVVKFLTDKNSKDTHLGLNSANPRKSAESVGSSKLKRIPTFHGHKLPAKVSVLLLNGPIRLNYTENISGKSQEILMCTSDVIEDVIRSENGIQQQGIVKRLLARSRPYIGKPVHIIFEPAKVTEFPSPVDSCEGNPVPLHPSPAKHNLLAQEPKVASTTDYQANDETDADMTLCSNWGNSSEETLVVKQNDQLQEIENRMPHTGSSGLDSSAKQNNRQETSSCTRAMGLQAKKKLKIRLCRRKKSLTALKRVNVKQIVNSVFRNFFHFYSVLGGHLKSGSVITKSNSILWLMEAGVATDDRSLEMANQLFKDIAGAKVVLNIFDYMQFLTMLARRQRRATVDLVRQLTICELPVASKIRHSQSSESRRLKTLPQSKHSEQGRAEIISVCRSQSLPNLKTTLPVFNS
ncbi:hypothetical protein AVEN_258297-1 [Araneus ventricosus]|uniref:Uncharacterized protein n=1 Tax=Araneus ventricosus TaxID=182803 RepID=A0A4Y2SAL5_ARAVE|nr:hypothetical protein AVEN_237951-1 [Araneus ventricosus]GBN85118.1 hypothetical protein AVEN_258297-1 [Araneus ventricosus]